MSQRMTVRDVAAMLTLLGHDELEAVGRALQRITQGGRDSYGKLVVASDPRNFVHEGLSEALDGFFYLAVACLRLEGNARLRNPDDSEPGVSPDPPPVVPPGEDVDAPDAWPAGTPTNGEHR